MKNQYFGDVNDYQKYGVLRALSAGTGIRTTVCWALTPDVDRSDGSRIGYLADPNSWRSREPEVFDALRVVVQQQRARSVLALETSGLLENCRYWRHTFPSSKVERSQYFTDLLAFAQESDLIFFDPDNGLEVKSCPPGTTNSSRYIYLHELRETWSRGHSIIVYQHFPRVARAPFVRRAAESISAATAAECVIAFRTSHVVFLLAPQPGHVQRLTMNLGRFIERWSGIITLEWHRFRQSGRPSDEAAEAYGPATDSTIRCAIRTARRSRGAPRLAIPQPG
ncbi:MAG TPA: hypothetical protein VMF04_03700 [Thermoplasmata archaeon]|nr:hypothetical protein [Thermoplasmata archaeon]